MAEAETLEAVPATVDADIEARARVQGWRPKEEYKGPADRWRPADEFLRSAETILPIVNARNRVLEYKVDTVTSELADVKKVLGEFREFASRGEQRAYERAKSELVAKRDVAVAHADTETFRQVERDIAELDKSVPAKIEPPRREPSPAEVRKNDPAIDEWIGENAWFNNDPVLRSVAQALDGDYMRSKSGLSTSDRLAAVKSEVMRRFSDKFENPARETATSVSSPSGNSGHKKAAKHSYENLPPDAKRACDKFVKTIPGYKAEEYVANYDWND